jgi:stearoyl-CoA desaturase (delta-9 desaturase)
MIIIAFIIIHWYVSLFFQSIFHHRYAAHGFFTMSKFWERVFYIGCFISQGSSYISANAYGKMHRMHHAHTDTPEDPHSPKNSSNMLMMMWDTRNNYINVYSGKTEVHERFTKNLPDWPLFEKYAHTFYTRFAWIFLYILFYVEFATAWWQFLFLPFTILMGSFQGAAVNWWAHRFGYVNHKMNNTSKNILPIDFVFWGESFHNNHHANPLNPNNSSHWFEMDAGYQMMRFLNKIGIIKLKPFPSELK